MPPSRLAFVNEGRIRELEKSNYAGPSFKVTAEEAKVMLAQRYLEKNQNTAPVEPGKDDQRLPASEKQ